MIKVTPLQQPTANTCAHACLAMVTGESIDALIERFGDRGICWEDDALVLVENGIFPVKIAGAGHPFPWVGAYLVSAPSLNQPGKLHAVIVEASETGYVVHDPNTGREGVEAYGPDAIMGGELARVDVTYLDTEILRGMKRKEGKAA
ncbi:hypothetical protein [Halomonas nitroreducens]|uniref:Peptidase C39 domain-containing protein n=1 Tax=Halomonas nitroreducens TaxID=447425 RepID=A0A3S0HSH5_9GAMM|nr:hypothetical protein [Halomonas nitroreducens]RTR01958.1 hypothetical protein EKG36_13195 [Halomonas nitroreducens]